MSAKHSLWAIIFCVFTTCFAGSAQAAIQAGTRDYNFTTHQMQFYDGSNWYSFNIGIPLGVCTPAQEGAMDFDNVLAVYQVCNGTNWVKIVGIPIALAFCSNKGEMEFTGGTYRVCNGLLWTNIKGTLLLI